MGGDANNDGASGNDLLFVPENYNDIVWKGAGAPTEAQWNDYLSMTGLDKYRGRVAPRNALDAPWIHTLDFHYDVTLPISVVQVQLTFDVLNLINLINHNAGLLRFVSNQTYTRAQLLGDRRGHGQADLHGQLRNALNDGAAVQHPGPPLALPAEARRTRLVLAIRHRLKGKRRSEGSGAFFFFFPIFYGPGGFSRCPSPPKRPRFRPSPSSETTSGSSPRACTTSRSSRSRPQSARMDRDNVMDPDLIRKFFELDLMGIEIPEEYGGLGANFTTSIAIIEALARVDAACAVVVDVQNTLVNNAIKRWASPAIQKKYFPQLAKQKVASYALSEAGSGSDAFALATTATPKGDRWVLNGEKLWITNGLEAELFLVFANVDKSKGYKGITAFLVESQWKGFTKGKKEDKLGIRASSTLALAFEDLEVPAENVVGNVGEGYKIAIETLNEGRIGIGAQMVGIGRAALDYATKYVKERQQFGQPLAQFQAVQHELARMDMELECARLAVYNAARLKEAGLPFAREGAIAKLKGSEVAEMCTSKGLELLGGYGYVKDYPLEKMYRDAKIGKIYEGTSFMQLNTIAKDVLKR